VKKPSPFPTVPRAKPETFDLVDPDMLKIERGVPIPNDRSGQNSKYSKLFQSLRPGDCVTCEPDETAQEVGAALRKALMRKQLPALDGCTVVSRIRCQDGRGRVWAAKVAK
jgi:hypothetical protein